MAEQLDITSKRLQDCPSYLNFPGEYGYTRYGEGIFIGYRGFDKLGTEVGYPFGHGLSYTTFAYEGLTVSQSGAHALGDLAIVVSCRVANSGGCFGQEVVQLYVGDPVSSMPRPVRELKGFTKVALSPGEQATVSFELGAADLSYWSTVAGGWVLEPGDFEISVGASSRDIRLSATIQVDAPPVRPALTHMSSLQEWMDDPRGRKAVDAMVATPQGDGLKLVLANAELLRMIGNFPISSLATITGMSLTAQDVAVLLGS